MHMYALVYKAPNELTEDDIIALDLIDSETMEKLGYPEFKEDAKKLYILQFL